MLSVPKKANDAMHLSLLEGCDVPTDSLGEVVLQDSFHVWDLRQIIKKGRERRVFLFDLHLLLAKEVKDSHGKAKYIYKTKFMTSELGVTEHIEGDECKFSVWTGREPMASDCRIVLKAPSLEVKQTWVRSLREVIQETYFSCALPPRSPARVRPTSSQRSSRDFEDTVLDETTENLDRNSLASFGSGNTTDSDKAGPEMTWVIYEHTSGGTGELTVTKGQQVEVVEPWTTRPDWWVVRVPGEPPLEGAVPAQVLKPQPQHPPHKTSPSRRPLSQPCEETLEASNSDPGSSVSAASPGKQRRGFSGWLGLRKTTQGKGEKTPSGGQSPATSNNASAPAPPPITAPATTSTSANSAPASSTVPIPAPTAAQAAASLAPSAAANATSGSSANNTEKTPAKKMSAEKKLKFPSFVNNVRSDDSIDSELGACAVLDEAEDDLPDVELPPPMKPIQDPQAVLQQAPSTAVPADATPAALQQHGGAANVQEPTGEEAGQEGEALPIHTPEELAILKKREYVLRELIDTEEIYVSDLRLICEGYMRHMQDPHGEPTLPDNLRDRRYRMIFGNIEAIYEWHRDKFLRELRMSLTHPELLGTLFRRFLEKRLYESYCRNKPVSEYIVSEHEHYFQELRHKLGHKLQLGDLLIKPIQRIQKYHLLVKKILSYSEQANCPPHVLAGLREAVHCTDIIPKNANLMMNFGRLQGFTGNITAQGKLLLHETMMVSDNPSGTDKGKELNVFLFEQCVIFSEAVGKRSQFTSPTYNYKGHVQVNKMELEEAEALGGFIIHSVSLKKPRHSFLCRAPDGKRQEWVSTLSNILQSQRIFGEALENPGAYLREQQHRDNNREHNTVGEGWCGLHYVPLSLDGRPELRQRTQRPHTKANTINLPTTTTTRSEDRKKAAASVASSAFSPTSPPHANVIP